MADASESPKPSPAPPADSTATNTTTTTTITSDEGARPLLHEIHSLVIDTGPIIHNPSSISLLQSKAEVLLTIPSVANEVRDETTRAVFETSWKPFLTFRTPKVESVKYVADFAKRTGDYAALSVTDLQVLGLTYEVWKEKGSVKAAPLEKSKGKKGKGKKNKKAAAKAADTNPTVDEEGWTTVPKGRAAKLKALAKISPQQAAAKEASAAASVEKADEPSSEPTDVQMEDKPSQAEQQEQEQAEARYADTPDAQLQREFDLQHIQESLSSLQIASEAQDQEEEEQDEEQQPEVVVESDSDEAEGEETAAPTRSADTPGAQEGEEEADDDSGGEWITPSNLPSHLSSSQTTTSKKPKTQIPVACTTSDFAMQNVLLQLHITLYSPSSLHRITQTRTSVLRCHGCFHIVRGGGGDNSRQFCPKCGGATLTTVSAGTDSDGKFKVYLKKDWQWNNRGNVYSIPKPRGGTASMKGVREELILREDQKEYERKVKEGKRKKETDLMDQDYLPGLLTGERQGKAGNVKVGAGRNVNAVKKGGKK